MYAIVRTGGKQYRVREGDEILVEWLDAPEGAAVALDVLLLERDGAVAVGVPIVTGAAAAATVTGHERAAKVIAFKYKNKTRRRQLRGHRQHLTRLTITSITGG
ncbi:MAG: 50S ribosomal protein L21 [Dehalococcoidia bacterium]|nr:50S ribosomal protein L21 [Dehalococcoidia bacterium]